MYTRNENSLKLVEIQESVLPEDEWLIGISNLNYFNGVGYSMPIGLRLDKSLAYEGGLLSGGRITAELQQSSNIDDQIKFSDLEQDDDDPLLRIKYNLSHDDLAALNKKVVSGIEIESPETEMLFSHLEQEIDTLNLYAFVPGIFYCSGPQTSVDGVLIEVTQKQLFGMTISSFRPEDVRPLDINTGMVLDETGFGKTTQLSMETLGTFHSESFLKDANISNDILQYSREIELAMRLSMYMPIKVLKQAYASSSFLRARIIRLLEDIEFYGLNPRRRIYVRNEKHPFGTVVEARYRTYESILDLGNESGIACPDEVDLEMELKNLSFSNPNITDTETDIENAVMDILHFINLGFQGKTKKEEVLKILTEEITI
ncbi:hypothetical protein EU527_10515 [Candidatus Thorarchaeota archaeon]|nr:MAG: hypothetical protein EU527_10515 [Candidatus Thorarchaeota archaeon]